MSLSGGDRAHKGTMTAPSGGDSDLQPMSSQVWVSWWKLCLSLVARAQVQKLRHGRAGSRMWCRNREPSGSHSNYRVPQQGWAPHMQRGMMARHSAGARGSMCPLSPWGHGRVQWGQGAQWILGDTWGHLRDPQPGCGRVLLGVTEGMGRGCSGFPLART